MKKRVYLIVLLIITLNFMYGNDLNTYSLKEVQNIKSGSKEGMLGRQSSVAGGHPGPITFKVSNDHIYIPDLVNYRINIYDKDFRYIKTINESDNKIVHFTRRFFITDQEDIIAFITGFGLKKINKEGKQVYFIKYKDLPRLVFRQNSFFLIKDCLFIYNDDHKIQYITPDGKIENTEKALLKLAELSEQSNNKSAKSAKGGGMEPEKAIDSSNIIIDDCFYSTEFHKHKAYYNKVKASGDYTKLNKLSSGGGVKPKSRININLDDYSKHFIGYDDDHNSYWRGIKDVTPKYKTYSVIIISKYGEILDGFIFGEYRTNESMTKINPDFSKYPTTGAKVAIAPNGDVYFLQGDIEKYTLYKVKRQW